MVSVLDLSIEPVFSMTVCFHIFKLCLANLLRETNPVAKLWQKQTVSCLFFFFFILICDLLLIKSSFFGICNFSFILCPLYFTLILTVHTTLQVSRLYFTALFWSKASSSVVKHWNRTGVGKAASSLTEDLVSCVVMYGTAEPSGYRD